MAYFWRLFLKNSEVGGITKGEVKSCDFSRNTRGEGGLPAIFDADVRKHGYQTGLETPVVHALNYECSVVSLAFC